MTVPKPFQISEKPSESDYDELKINLGEVEVSSAQAASLALEAGGGEEMTNFSEKKTDIHLPQTNLSTLSTKVCSKQTS